MAQPGLPRVPGHTRRGQKEGRVNRKSEGSRELFSMCEWTHGHWQGLCNRTSVGEREMANSGGVMIGVWGWAL